MGVYIDMEMPHNCVGCPLINANVCPCKTYSSVLEYTTSRHHDCYLIEVPEPHGDLIDRDKLRAKEFIHDGNAYAVVMSRDIRNAPTIIPASEEVSV